MSSSGEITPAIAGLGSKAAGDGHVSGGSSSVSHSNNNGQAPAVAPQDKDQQDSRFPPGFKFQPRGYELIIGHLDYKLANKPLPIADFFHDVNIYKYHPKDLADTYKEGSRNTWYFFVEQGSMNRRMDRPRRIIVLRYGSWESRSTDRKVKYRGLVVGRRRSLVYYEDGMKTNWVMDEFTRSYKGIQLPRTNGFKKEDITLCRIRFKRDKKRRSIDQGGVHEITESLSRQDMLGSCPPNAGAELNGLGNLFTKTMCL